MDEVVGRGVELELIARLLAASPSATILLEGEAGIGKTTVWMQVIEDARASGRHVLISEPAESEARLSYAGLADLLAEPFPDVRAGLPPPQANALAVALLLEEPGVRPPDETAVARGMLAAVRLLAKTRGSLVLAIDDVRWLDAPTLNALVYTLRRVTPGDSIKLIATHRTGAPEPPGFSDRLAPERVRLGPISMGGLNRILRLRTGRPLARPRLLDLYDASSGNPLHAIELARADEPEAANDGRAVTSLLRARIEALPETTRRALLLIAASPNRTLDRIERAWGNEVATALKPALGAGLVAIVGTTVQFAHPLLARLTYAEAPDDARRSAHAQLATTAVTDEERATHLGRSVAGPDAQVAGEIERAAGEARRRGVRSVSATLFMNAAGLTPVEAARDRARRTLAAASGWFEAGDLARAQALLDELAIDLPAGAERAETRLRLGLVLHESGRWPEAMARFGEALSEATEPKLVAEIRRGMAITAGYIHGVAEGREHAEAALAAAEVSGDPETLTYCLAIYALALVLGGVPRAVHGPYLERALALERQLEGRLTGWTHRLVAAEHARLSLDIDRARELYESVLDEAVASGDATLEHWAAYGLGSTEMLAGEYLKAGELADHTIELAETTGVLDLYGRRLRAQVDAHLGRAPQAREQGLAALASAEARGGRLHAMTAHAALGQLALASGDPALAARDLGAARAIAVAMGYWNGVTIRSMLDEAEAAVAVGSVDIAEQVLALVAERLDAELATWARPLLARGEGLLLAARGDAAAAEALLERSADELRGGSSPLESARALLVLGTVRRRARRHAAARAPLAEAAAIFGRLGAELWAGRARDELARIPGRRGRDVQGLTPTEERIAALVARGRSNREVAGELFVSVKTVELTLTHVYQKLGVRSRAELAARFSAPVDAAGPSKD